MNTTAEMPDEKLIQFYLNGNPRAMATLVELYKDRIYSSIFLMVQDKFAAEEIFKEVFIVIINNLMAGKAAGEDNFLQWALSISHRICIDYARKTKTAMIIEMKKQETTVTGAVNFSVLPQQHAAYFYESHDKIKTMISQLPNEQREVVALSHYAGLSFKEIACIMKCSVGAALDLMQVALNNLFKQMAEKEMLLQ